MIPHLADTVTVWPETGSPERLVWRGTPYRVTDSPTPLEDELLASMAHPPRVPGWRFTAVGAHGISKVFDIVYRNNRYELAAVYE